MPKIRPSRILIAANLNASRRKSPVIQFTMIYYIYQFACAPADCAACRHSNPQNNNTCVGNKDDLPKKYILLFSCFLVGNLSTYLAGA